MAEQRVASKIKVDLVDFQQRLNKNLDEADQAKSGASLIGFTSAGRNWLLDLSDLREIEGVPTADRIQRIDLTKNWVLGIANFKGYIYTLIDMQMFLGKEASSLTMNARALLMHPKFLIQAALVVPDVAGLMSEEELVPLSKEEWKPDVSWVSSGMRDQKGQVWELLDLGALASAREMLDVEA